MIVASAILHKGIVFTGFRHNDIIHYLVKLGYPTRIQNHEQGFINDRGDFLTKYDALSEANISGQVFSTDMSPLTSEDLW